LEPVALPDLPGTQQKTVVSHPPVENDNSTVPLRRNVSQDEPLVTKQSVSMMVSVLEKNLANVVTVSTDQHKQTQPKKQTTKTSVVSSDESKPCVVMTSHLTTNQERVVSHQKNGTQPQEPVKSVAKLRHHLNSKQVSINPTSAVMVTQLTAVRHTSNTD
jgi:hypothetical protein